jgi:RNA polymerase sigma-70 factor (ECF subfamily)
MKSSIDEPSFVRFAQETLPVLMSLLHRIAPPTADVEDLAAEALAKAFARWGRLASVDYRRAWVLRVAINLAHDQSRAVKRRGPATRLNEDDGRDEVGDGVTSRIVLLSALDHLSRKQREAVALHFASDLSIADTARAMGVTEGTARTHLDRGIKQLRELLGSTAWEGLDASD